MGLSKQQVYQLYRPLLVHNVCTEHVCGEYSSCMCLYDSSDLELISNPFCLVISSCFLLFPLVPICLEMFVSINVRISVLLFSTHTDASPQFVLPRICIFLAHLKLALCSV